MINNEITEHANFKVCKTSQKVLKNIKEGMG